MSSDRSTWSRSQRLRGRWNSGGELDDELDDDVFYAARPVRSSREHGGDDDGAGRRRRRELRRPRRDSDPLS